MGNTLTWGTLSEEDCCERREELLQPRFEQVGIRAFAWIRLFIAVYFIGHNGFVCAVTYDTFWMFLTNLVHLACMLNYIMLTVSHLHRGHFRKVNIPEQQKEKEE